jgi:hypothetical protein
VPSDDIKPRERPVPPLWCSSQFAEHTKVGFEVHLIEGPSPAMCQALQPFFGKAPWGREQESGRQQNHLWSFASDPSARTTASRASG